MFRTSATRLLSASSSSSYASASSCASLSSSSRLLVSPKPFTTAPAPPVGVVRHLLLSRPATLLHSTPPAFQALSPSLRAFSTHSVLLNAPSQQPKPKQEQKQEQENDRPSPEDDDAAAQKGSLKDRLRYLTRRYGWWALGVYLAASTVDFALTFAAIHLLGAQHIRQLEMRIRSAVGLGQRPASSDAEESNSDQEEGSSAIWTEAVLAYTIHKTLLLPLRVAFTAAVTPSFVKWLVSMGWTKSHDAVRRAAKEAAVKKAVRN
ncbi:DUF1279 superfamily [Thecaphora frezii]